MSDEMFKMKTKMERVKALLQEYPNSRDDDNDLIRKYAQHYGAIVVSDTITRARRKLQQEDVRLRGREWNDRHGVKPETMQMELGYNVKP